MMASVAQIGRVKTALVFPAAAHAQGVVFTLLARTRESTEFDRITTTGLVKFDAALLGHLERHALTLVDTIGRALLPDYRPVHVELSAVNLGAASIQDTGMTVSGFSADAPFFLSVISALLRIPFPSDIMATGHLASDLGDIGPVGGLPEKLAAAVFERSIRRCCIPTVESLQSLFPQEHDRIRQAIILARRYMRILEVRDVAELMRAAFDDEAIVLGSLRSGFFETAQQGDEAPNPIAQAIPLLTENLEARFYSAIEEKLFPLNIRALRQLLAARAKYHISRKQYPRVFGAKLRALLSSLPPASRRKAGLFPLLPKTQSLALSALAAPGDFDDVQDFLATCSGRGLLRTATSNTIADPPVASADAAVACVLAELSEDSLTAQISAPIDVARGLFVLEGITAESDTEFWETVTSFYVTLLRHTGSPDASAENAIVAAESHGLLEHAFADKGGVAAAKQEGRFPTRRGGMRFVLDVLADQFKSERQAEYIRRVVAEAFDPLDWPATVRFMSGLLDQIRPQLPADTLPESPAQLVPRCADILLAHVRSRDRMTQLVRSL